jgi:hypothetical protein
VDHSTQRDENGFRQRLQLTREKFQYGGSKKARIHWLWILTSVVPMLWSNEHRVAQYGRELYELGADGPWLAGTANSQPLVKPEVIELLEQP